MSKGLASALTGSSPSTSRDTTARRVGPLRASKGWRPQPLRKVRRYFTPPENHRAPDPQVATSWRLEEQQMKVPVPDCGTEGARSARVAGACSNSGVSVVTR